ncbi:phage tail tip lysozyme [Arthrobacter sp. NPDC056691]|uniref:phage tail tip lysozyme n=1 Tax=Arthrobacter sp. NPDC056691 TaxID=3345913 RepID=UPI0036727A5A
MATNKLKPDESARTSSGKLGGPQRRQAQNRPKQMKPAVAASAGSNRAGKLPVKRLPVLEREGPAASAESSHQRSTGSPVTRPTPATAGRLGRLADVAKARNSAGGFAGRAVEGDGASNVRRYAGKAITGGVNGGMQGGLHGAAAGAAKEVGGQALQDTVKSANKVIEGRPDATTADQRQLGAGGTGYARSGGQGEGPGSKVAKGLAVGGAAAATPPAMVVLMAMALLNWLKSMFFAAMALAANAGLALWMFMLNLAKTVGHAVAAPFMAIGGIVANSASAVLGVAVATTVAPAVAAASGVFASVTAIALLSTVLTGVINSTSLTEGSLNAGRTACVTDAGPGTGNGSEVNPDAEQNAKTVYSVLSRWGMPDENIAGILGNWSQESGVDPTSVESISDEPYRIGPRKQAAWDGGFTHIPGQSHGGIGLGQWSNGRTTMLLEYAKGKRVDWHTIDTQLAFMVQGDNPGDVAVFKDMISTSQGSPSAAAVHFHDKWERSNDNQQMMAERTADAGMWFGKMSGWAADKSTAGRVENITGGIIEGISNGMSTILAECQDSGGPGPISLKNGGMTQVEAQALVTRFNEEGDKFLDGRYGDGGGPGSCGANHAMNCVSFSTYFVNKYTTFQTYPKGDGVRTAFTIAEQTGKQLSSMPAPYSVGSGPGTGPAGHTLVVLGVEGDKVVLGEAGYCAFMGRVRIDSATRMVEEGWKFVDVSDIMLPTDQIKTS